MLLLVKLSIAPLPTVTRRPAAFATPNGPVLPFAAAAELATSVPPFTVTLPVKLLAPAATVSVPAPSFTSAVRPLIVPLNAVPGVVA